MGAAKTVIKTVIVIMGILLILASFGALVVANEIDSRVSEECEDAVGSIGEIIGAFLVVIPILSNFWNKSEG